MANLAFAHSSAPLKPIQEIQFGLMSPEEIKAMSVVHVVYPETMDETRTKPRDQGLNDPLLGSVDRHFKCKTCTENMSECPGHFGHIELAKPVYHPGFINKVKKCLEIVCHNCSKPLADRSEEDFANAMKIRNPKQRFAQVWKICQKKTECDNKEPSQKDGDGTAPGKFSEGHGGCGNQQPRVRKGPLQLNAVLELKDEEGVKRKETKPITPEMAHSILRRISDSDMIDMGLNIEQARPEWMIVTVLPVPPPPVRPSISMDGTSTGMRNEDDLTYKLGDIIRANGNVRQAIQDGAPNHIINDFENLLQYHVATYMDNDINGQPRAMQKSGRPIKAIRARLKGKEGRLRGNLMGKRVDFSARTVITGDANISLDQVGVPRSIARVLTYPETVTPYNIGKLTQYVQNGPNEHPGAKYVIRADGTRIDLRHHKRAGAIQLEYGWKVERHLIDGDYIIFNRQPSLHKESMMGHRVKVMPYSTFRLNLSVTSPYNADFDGDEMNLHVPQTEETRAEVRELCLVPLNIVSPQGNKPLMGIVQDTLAGVYKMCRRDTFLTKEEVMNLMLWVPEWDGVIPRPAILKPRPRWTGKQMFSLVIPKVVSISSAKNMCPADDAGFEVQQGQLMFGLPVKKFVGAASGGIIHICYNELGPQGAMAFLNGCQQVVNYWLLQNGHSIGIGDTIPDAETIIKIEEVINEQKEKVRELTQQATNNLLERKPGLSIRETFEQSVSVCLNTARDSAGKVTEDSLKDINNAITMSRSGSKGSQINISQMSALVGQQMVEGKRIPFGFKYRTLPHFTKDDYSPEARGFVENSYLRGLTPSEFFFHAMAGREGLIDTAVKTAETGYIQRRLVKALEDAKAQYDGTIRNSLGDIIQFAYGEDGLDAMIIENQRLEFLNCDDGTFEKRYRLDVMDEAKYARALDWLEYGKEIVHDPEVQEHLDREFEQLLADRKQIRDIIVAANSWKLDKTDDMCQLPLNITRIIETAKKVFKVDETGRSDLRPQDVIPAVENLLDKIKITQGSDKFSVEQNYNGTILIKAHFRSRLSFKRLAIDHKLSKLAFDHIIGELESRWLKAFVSPGEMVGVLAAQSIGEPATQMTLNTFHFAGVSSKNVTLGVPRLKEILNVASNIKTPSMVVFLKTEKDVFATEPQALGLRQVIEHTTLRTVTRLTEIYYDPDITSTAIPDDVDMVESYFLIPDSSDQVPIDRQSKWLLRITLDRGKMLDMGLHVDDVAHTIQHKYKNDLAVVFSDNNAEELVVRIRTILEDNKDETIEQDVLLKRLQTHLLDGVTLGGVKGIVEAFVSKAPRAIMSKDGKIWSDNDHPEYFLDTQGSALREVLTVDGVDFIRSYTNDLWQIVDVLGIEGARTSLMRELTRVLAFDGSYVNHRHMAILCDVMTYRGTMAAVTRHGINRSDTGALMRCSFEETVEILLEAAAAGELDDCRGISENVMLGQMAPMGTGHFDVVLDPKMLETVISDNSRMGLMPGMTVKGGEIGGAATPYDNGSPMADGGFMGGGSFSPTVGSFSPIVSSGPDGPSGFNTEYGGGFGGSTVNPYSGKSPGAMSPFTSTSPLTSPMGSYGGSFSPVSPRMGYSPASPNLDLGLTRMSSSPQFTPGASPAWTPSGSPGLRLGVSPSSPDYIPHSPQGYSPTSPKGYSPVSPNYSPASPAFSPFSPSAAHSGAAALAAGATSPIYSPTSPNNAYSPTSPTQHYSPTSPVHYSPGQQQSPTSPRYSPTSPQFSPKSPGRIDSAEDSYSPTSPNND